MLDIKSNLTKKHFIVHSAYTKFYLFTKMDTQMKMKV